MNPNNPNMTHRVKTILIPIDGSPQAEEAIQSLKAFPFPKRVLLLHCFAIPQLAYPGTGMSVGRNFSEAAEQALRKEGSRILERAASQLPAQCGEVSQHLEMGDTASVILSMAQEHSVNLILIGSRGLGAIQEHMLGSVSHRVVTHSPCPTLIVKSPLMPLNNILLPIEHLQDAEWAIDWLAQKPFQSTPQISVLHVIPFTQPILPMGTLLPEAWKKELQTGGDHFVQDVINTLKKIGYQAEGMVESGTPSLIIQDHITRLQPQLVLIGTHHRSLLNRFAHGSVSHATVHHAPCSVLLLKKPVE